MLSTASPSLLQSRRIGAHKRSKRGLWVTIRRTPAVLVCDLALPLYLVFRRVPASAIRPALGQGSRRLGQETAGPPNPGLYCANGCALRPDTSALGAKPTCSEPTEFTPLLPRMITNNPANMSVRGASTETTRFYMGSLMSFLVKSSQTANGLCLLESIGLNLDMIRRRISVTCP
jgi:hypothetical protein